MARKTRLFVAGAPYHIIQRGNNKNAIFFSENDFLFFLKVLLEAKTKHPCIIYGYCLMTNHFHLLIEPKEKGNISLLMKLLGAKYVHYINQKYNRTGSLWEGRFRCSLIDKEAYFLACLHYIEMNPIRAGLNNSPELYRWSSYKTRAFGVKNTILDVDPWYNSLGINEKERQSRYRDFFKEFLPESTYRIIREMSNRNGIIGNADFVAQISKSTGKEVVFRLPGRPKNKKNNSDPII